MLYGNLNKKRGSSLYGDPIKENFFDNTVPGTIPGMDETGISTDTQISGLAPSVLNSYSSPTPSQNPSFNSVNPLPTNGLPSSIASTTEQASSMPKLGNVSEGAGGLSGSIPNYNAIAYASLLPAIGQSIKDITASADRTPLTLANFNEAGSRFDKMSSDLTQAKQDTLASSNAQKFQIDQSSTGGLRNARLAGANSSYRDALGRVAANEQQLRNQVLQTQGQAEANFATDEANRRTANVTANEQNKAATEDIRRQASQNIFNLVGKNANNRQMFEDIKANNLTLQQASTAEGFKFLETIAQNFNMGGSEEYQAYLKEPNNPAVLKKLMDAFQIKFKEVPLEEPTTNE